MKNGFFVLLVLGVCTLAFAGISFSQSVSEPKKFKVGKSEVIAIADSVRDANLGIFSVDAKEYEKYVKSGKVPSAVMTYIIKTGNETVLVDTGNGNEYSMLMDGLKKNGIKPEDITTVLITHMHGDHIGGLLLDGEIAFPNAKVRIGKIEKEFWTDDKSLERFPERKTNFDLAKRVVNMYGEKVLVFEFGDTVVPGVTALDSSGHTPGHTAYMLESAGKKMMFIGDIVNVAAVQVPRPDISSKYDMDSQKAAQTRQQYISKAENKKLAIAGAHLPFPGIWKVKKDKEKEFELKAQ